MLDHRISWKTASGAKNCVRRISYEHLQMTWALYCLTVQKYGKTLIENKIYFSSASRAYFFYELSIIKLRESFWYESPASRGFLVFFNISFCMSKNQFKGSMLNLNILSKKIGILQRIGLLQFNEKKIKLC